MKVQESVMPKWYVWYYFAGVAYCECIYFNKYNAFDVASEMLEKDDKIVVTLVDDNEWED